MLSHVSDPLIKAAENGQTETVRALLLQGVALNKKNYSNTALILAAANGHVEIVRLLLNYAHEKKIRIVDQENAFGITALLVAASEGHAEIVKLLLNHEAKVDVSNLRGGTALMLATRHGHEAVVKLLKKYIEEPHVMFFRKAAQSKSSGSGIEIIEDYIKLPSRDR